MFMPHQDDVQGRASADGRPHPPVICHKMVVELVDEYLAAEGESLDGMVRRTVGTAQELGRLKHRGGESLAVDVDHRKPRGGFDHECPPESSTHTSTV